MFSCQKYINKQLQLYQLFDSEKNFKNNLFITLLLFLLEEGYGPSFDRLKYHSLKDVFCFVNLAQWYWRSFTNFAVS